MEVYLPYGKDKILFRFPEENLLTVVKPKDLPPLPDPEKAVKDAIDNPINSERLSDLVKKNFKITIVMPDIVHKCFANKLALHVILKELNLLGVEKDNITIINAIGLHRVNSREEMELMYGKDVLENYRVICHNAKDKNSLVNLGESEFGDPVSINRLVIEADLCIGISDVGSVPVCYSGGSKMISVGCASVETIASTHCLSIYYNERSKCGVYIGNPFKEHLDAILRKAESSSKSGKFFLVNTVFNSKDEVVGVTAGDFIDSHLECCKIADKQWKIPVPKEADIVVAAAGYPNDDYPYYISTSLTMLVSYPKPVFRKGGIVIFPAPCSATPKPNTLDYDFIEAMRNTGDFEDLHEKMKEYERKKILTPIGLMRAYGKQSR